MVNEVNGIIEFYAHAVPYLASIKEKGITAVKGETISIAFPGLNINNRQAEKSLLLKENLRVPRGPDN